MSGGNQVRVPSTGFAYFGTGVKRTVTVGNGGRNPPRKQQVKCQKWQRVQRNNKRTFAELEKWLDKSSRDLKATSAYLLEHQVEVNSQLSRLTIGMWLRTEQ